jgi:diadenosine tetraphosphatase ApaH/serine/threonine PP2A family protein phosphatase
MERFTFCLLGNHEEAALFVPAWFNPRAKRAVEWTRDQINSSEESSAALWNYLGDLKQVARDEDLLFVHGSPRKPTTEYIRVMDTRYDREKMDEIFAMIRRICFVGHSHVPGVFTPNYRFLKPGNIGDAVRLGKDKVVINVGSVGQPRDGDVRACYVTLEKNVVRWHRVEYDLEATVAKIRAIDGLPDINAERLQQGR